MSADHPLVDRSWFEKLKNQGVGDLLQEYGSTNDHARRGRLERFFEVCAPVDAPCGAHDREVKIASDRDLIDAGRLTALVPGASCAFELLGQIVPEPEIQLIDLRDSIILPDQTVFAQGLYLTHQLRHMSGNWLQSGEGYDLASLSGLSLSTGTARLTMPPGVVRLPDSHVYFLFQAIVGSLSFGHFIIDVLTQIIVFDRLKLEWGDRLIPVVVSDLPDTFKWPGIRWLFSKLIGSPDNIIHLRPHARLELKRGFTSNRLAHLGASGVSTRAFSYLRNVLFSRCTVSPEATSPKRVYISRKDAGYREAANIQEVEGVLERHGFQTVVIQELTPQQAFDALHGAEVIVGMHGSGLMYYLYTEKPALVIELSHPGFEWGIILACAAACGHTPVRVDYVGTSVDVQALEGILHSVST